MNLLLRGDRATDRRNGVSQTVPRDSTFRPLILLQKDRQSPFPHPLLSFKSKTDRSEMVQTAQKQSLILAPGKQRPTKLCEFKASLVYSVSPLEQIKRQIKSPSQLSIVPILVYVLPKRAPNPSREHRSHINSCELTILTSLGIRKKKVLT